MLTNISQWKFETIINVDCDIWNAKLSYFINNSIILILWHNGFLLCVMKITTWNFLKSSAVLQSNFFFKLTVPRQLPQNFSIVPCIAISFFDRSLISCWLTKYMISVVPLDVQDRMYTSTRVHFKIEFVYWHILSHLHPMQHRELLWNTLVSKVQLIWKNIILPHFLTSTIYNLSWHVVSTAIKGISLFLLSYLGRFSLSLPILALAFTPCPLYLCSFIFLYFLVTMAFNF